MQNLSTLFYTSDGGLTNLFHGRRLSFVWSRLGAMAQLSTRYTTADIALEMDSTCATVGYNKKHLSNSVKNGIAFLLYSPADSSNMQLQVLAKIISTVSGVRNPTKQNMSLDC